MRNLVSLSILVLLTSSLFAQSGYNDYSLSQKKSVFYDDFFNDNNNWAGGCSPAGFVSFSGGNMTFWSNSQTDPAGCVRYIEMDESKDFEIETKIKFISGEENSAISLVYGKSTVAWDKYDLNYTYTGYYKIDYCANSEYTNIIEWEESSIVKPDNFNTLTLRKVNNNCYFFINRQLVHSMYFKPFYGKHFGFQVPKNTKILVDYLSISYIEKEIYNTPPEIVITEPDIDRAFKLITEKSVRVAGRAKDSDGIYEVTANGIEAYLQSGGYFSVNVPLTIGENTVTIKATDTKMKSSTRVFKVNRKSESAFSGYQSNDKRVALIFGNSDYSGAADLDVYPINDAMDIASTLSTLGFEVIMKTDANLNTMNNAIRKFGHQNRDADVALFYFAGHGMQVEQVNYLLPIGVEIKDKNDVHFECISVNTVQRIMETSNPNRLNLIILDACRNNPFRTWQRGGETGLADMTPPSGTLIAFATSPGSTAFNKSGRNGLYTGELIKQLKISQRIEDVFINTRVEVEKKSGGHQSPWELARLRGKYFLVK